MKYLLSLAMSLIYLSVHAQVELILGFGSAANSERTIVHSYEQTYLSKLPEHDPTKALSRRTLQTRLYTTTSQKTQLLELGIGYNKAIRNHFSLRLAATLLSSRSDINGTVDFQSEELGSEVVDYTWPTSTSSGGSFCDQFSTSENYDELRTSDKLLSITSINLMAGVEYQIPRTDFTLGTMVFLRTPIGAREEVFVSEFDREEVDGQWICRSTGSIETVHRIDNLSYLQLGIAPHVAYHFNERIRLQLSIRYFFDDVFYVEEDLGNSFLFTSPRSLKPIESSIQLSYIFGKATVSVEEGPAAL